MEIKKRVQMRTLSVKIGISTFDKLHEIAKQADASISDVVRSALEHFVTDYQKKIE